YFLALAHDAQGDYRRAIEFLRWNVSTSKGEPIFERVTQADLPFLPSRARLVLCLAELGEFQEGTTHGDEAVRRAEAVYNPYRLTLEYSGAGHLHLRKGDFDRAITALERSLRLCQTWDIRAWFPTVASALGYAWAVVGRAAEVLPLLERAMEQAISRR